MTGDQAAVVARLLGKASEGHHGDCVGADAQFHKMCMMLEVPIIIHPPDDDRYRAFCEGALVVHPPRPYLERDHIIVDSCELLVATPKEAREPAPARGQGTWSTIRYARRSEKPLRIVWPVS